MPSDALWCWASEPDLEWRWWSSSLHWREQARTGRRSGLWSTVFGCIVCFRYVSTRTLARRHCFGSVAAAFPTEGLTGEVENLRGFAVFLAGGWLATSQAVAQAPVDSIRITYRLACYTGMAHAQKVLPVVPQKDSLLGRGYQSCEGSLIRLTKSGELAKEPSIATFACGYAVGAMFAKYGFGDEVVPPSKRVLQAIDSCMEALRKQGIV